MVTIKNTGKRRRIAPMTRAQTGIQLQVGTDLSLYVLDQPGRRVLHCARSGQLLGSFGHREIKQPGPIAVDRARRVFVADTFDGSLKVFLHGELIQDLPAAELGLRQINDVWINDGGIILSGGAGAGVKFMRLAALPGR